MSEWISVEDRLPLAPDPDYGHRSVSVIATNGSCVDCCEFDCGSGWSSWNEYNDIQSSEITHWMPLPEPPNEG